MLAVKYSILRAPATVLASASDVAGSNELGTVPVGAWATASATVHASAERVAGSALWATVHRLKNQLVGQIAHYCGRPKRCTSTHLFNVIVAVYSITKCLTQVSISKSCHIPCLGSHHHHYPYHDHVMMLGACLNKAWQQCLDKMKAINNIYT